MQKDILLHFWVIFFIKMRWKYEKCNVVVHLLSFLFVYPHCFSCLPPLFCCLPLWTTLRIPGNKPQNGRKIYYCLLSQLLVQGQLLCLDCMKPVEVLEDLLSHHIQSLWQRIRYKNVHRCGKIHIQEIVSTDTRKKQLRFVSNYYLVQTNEFISIQKIY